MDALLGLLAKIAERPDVGILGAIVIGQIPIIWKLLTLLVESRTRNVQLDADVKAMQQQRISDLQETQKVLERNALANQAVANVLNTALPAILARH